MTEIQSTHTLPDWEKSIGEAVRHIRITEGYDQIALAHRANLSRSAVQSLERGTGSRLRTLLAVLRALNRMDALDALMPDDDPSPLEVLAEARRASKPQRARKAVD